MLKNISKFAIIFLAVSFFSGCATKTPDIPIPREGLSEKFTVALIADSQFQSTKSAVYRPIWKSAVTDKFIDVTIRTPVQNYLAENSLRYLLNKILSKSKPDIILYLGDGANNGCKDEVTQLFSVLKEYQDKGIGIFFLIGNHDYLGAGNTSNIKIRNDLCTNIKNTSATQLEENVLTKLDLINITHNFNLRSASNIKSKGLNFIDNYTEGIKESCNSQEVQQHLANECFYSGYISGAQLEIFLTDTSNYGSAAMLQVNGIAGLELYGLVGGICCEREVSGQWSWFKGIRDVNHNKQVSIFASHYPTEGLEIFHRKVHKLSVFDDKKRRRIKKKLYWYQNRRVTPLMDIVSRMNTTRYWLSAHTHAEEYKKGYARIFQYTSRSGDYLMKDFTTFNVGSTTDYSQHALLINFKNNSAETTEVKLFDANNEGFCRSLIDSINKNNFGLDGMLQVNGKSSGSSVFGLEKEYRDWVEYDYMNAGKNIKKLLKKLGDSYLSLACLANYAAKNERR